MKKAQTLSDEEKNARTRHRIRVIPAYAFLFVIIDIAVESLMIWLLEDTPVHSVPVLGTICEWIWVVTWLLSYALVILVPLIFVFFGILGLVVELVEPQKQTPNTKALALSAIYLIAGLLAIFIFYNNQQWFF